MNPNSHSTRSVIEDAFGSNNSGTSSRISNQNSSSVIDKTIIKYFGKHGPKQLGFVSAVVIASAIGIPIFMGEGTKLGHDYMSSDKPEDIRADQEHARRQYRAQRNLNKQQEQQQNQQQATEAPTAPSSAQK